VVPDLKGVTLQHHYDAIKAMVKQKTGRAMQEKKVTVIGKNGKPKEGESEPSRYISTKMRVTIPTLMIRQPGNPIFMHTSSGTG